MTQGSGMDQPSYSLPPVHTTSPWKLLVRPCLAAGSEDLSSVALVLHRFSLNKPGFLVGACIRSSLLSSGVWNCLSAPLRYIPGVLNVIELPWASTTDIQANGRVSALGSCFNLYLSSSSSKLSPSLSPRHLPELKAILSSSGPTKVSWSNLLCVSQTRLSLHP